METALAGFAEANACKFARELRSVCKNLQEKSPMSADALRFYLMLQEACLVYLDARAKIEDKERDAWDAQIEPFKALNRMIEDNGLNPHYFGEVKPYRPAT